MRLLSHLVSKVTVHILEVLHQMLNVSALLLDNTLEPETPLTNVFDCCF